MVYNNTRYGPFVGGTRYGHRALGEFTSLIYESAIAVNQGAISLEEEEVVIVPPSDTVSR
jgi:hypothetical protein